MERGSSHFRDAYETFSILHGVTSQKITPFVCYLSAAEGCIASDIGTIMGRMPLWCRPVSRDLNRWPSECESVLLTSSCRRVRFLKRCTFRLQRLYIDLMTWKDGLSVRGCSRGRLWVRSYMLGFYCFYSWFVYQRCQYLGLYSVDW
jgi:hypothetical protein